MGITQEISAKPGFIYVVKKGIFSVVEAEEKFKEILESIAYKKVENVIIDARELIGNPETIERFCYGKLVADTLLDFASRGVSPNTKLAYIMKVPLRDPKRFGETVAVNRGMICKTFDNLEDALSWLGIAQ